MLFTILHTFQNLCQSNKKIWTKAGPADPAYNTEKCGGIDVLLLDIGSGWIGFVKHKLTKPGENSSVLEIID